MFTVALIGPDGAGKSTIGRRLLTALRLPIKYVYLGINLEASNFMLPTTRLVYALKRMRGGQLDMGGPPDPRRAKKLPRWGVKRVAAELKSGLRMVNLLAEEWYRQGVIWYYLRRGNIVLFDRHFLFDYYFHDVVARDAQRPLSSHLHGFMLRHFYPRPDLVICLDAPAEVLFARKGEGTVETIEQRRQEYLQLRNLVDHFVLVDVTQPEEVVAGKVTALIQDFYFAKARKIPQVQHG
jgi:thymidylate kinase